jgi:AhpD family alkylhydroperoxidase
VSGAARDAFERKIAERGSVPNLYRVFAHRPWILSTMDAHFSAVMGSGSVPLKLKELLALQSAMASGSEYGVSTHRSQAERLGATKEQIECLLSVENGPYTEKEKAALHFGLEMTRDANRISEVEFAELGRHFEEGEVVEIACVVGLLAYFNRFADALKIEPTKPKEGTDR